MTYADLPPSLLQDIAERGYAVLPGVVSCAQVDAILHGLTEALDAPQGAASALRSTQGGVYGARNILTLWPAASAIVQKPPLSDALVHVLGPHCGLVRGLYFDKPPGQTWALPWHKDLTVAVRDNRRPSRY